MKVNEILAVLEEMRTKAAENYNGTKTKIVRTYFDGEYAALTEAISVITKKINQ